MDDILIDIGPFVDFAPGLLANLLEEEPSRIKSPELGPFESFSPGVLSESLGTRQKKK